MEAVPAHATQATPPAQSEILFAPGEPRWTTDQILQGGKEAIIVHGQSVYRLRVTRSGKLILHK